MAKLNTLHHELNSSLIQMQVLQHRPVLRQRPLLPYVPLPDVGSANVPAFE